VNDSEISDLARLLPTPAARDLPVGRRQILKEHLMTEFRLAQENSAAAPPPYRGRRWRGRHPILAATAGIGVLAATAALATIILVPSSSGPATMPGTQGTAGTPGTPGSASAGPASPAIVLLDKIAAAAQSQPSQQVSGSEFMYIRSEVAYPVDTITNGHETSVMAKPHERQIWLPVASDCIAGLLIEGGSSTPLGGGPYKGCGMGNLAAPTYRLLQSLPTNPRALLSLIYAQTRGQGTSPNEEAFATIGDLIREAIVPPQTAAALYRAAALIPGVTVINNVADAAGRSGVAAGWRAGNTVEAWIFDPGTLQYMGERDFNTATGAVSGESAVMQRAFVARPGALP
jgi:hypothetical protein